MTLLTHYINYLIFTITMIGRYACPHSKMGIYCSLREGNWPSERASNLPKILQQISGKVWPSNLRLCDS